MTKNDRLTRAERDAIEVLTAKDIAKVAFTIDLTNTLVFKLCCETVKARKAKETGCPGLHMIGPSYGVKEYTADVGELMAAAYAELVRLSIDDNQFMRKIPKGGE